MPDMRRFFGRFGLLVLVVATIVYFFLPGIIEARMNPVREGDPHHAGVSTRATALHRQLTIVDLHADSLLWGRDLNKRGARGQVDVPRLIEGNVALQIFDLVTKSPKGLNIHRNEANAPDDITRLALASHWPIETWRSLLQRALYQARRLRAFADASDGKLTLIASRADLDRYLERRAREPQITAGLLGIEGAHALDGDLANLDVVYDAGVRIMSVAHFFDNELGGSASGVKRGGLTALGKELITRMQEKHMLIDLAHCSPQVIDDVLAQAKGPVIVSHTGVKGTCDNQRNLSDDQLKRIAATGGVIGIGYWDVAVCGKSPAAIAKAVRHARDVAGAEHVALGSDFDGAVATPFDTAQLPRLTDALLAAGLSEHEVRMIMGENALRVLRAVLQ
jgi:microsomal dipeptidase-like Zn-dependent dipeptidase